MNQTDRKNALDTMVKLTLALRLCDESIVTNMARLADGHPQAQDVSSGGGHSTPSSSVLVETDRAGNLRTNPVHRDRTEYDADLAAAFRLLVRLGDKANRYAPVQVNDVKQTDTAPEGWCRSCYRVDHDHAPVALGQYAAWCRFCGDFRSRVAKLAGAKLGKDKGLPPRDLLERRKRYNRLTADEVTEAVVKVATPLMPKRKKAS